MPKRKNRVHKLRLRKINGKKWAYFLHQNGTHLEIHLGLGIVSFKSINVTEVSIIKLKPSKMVSRSSSVNLS